MTREAMNVQAAFVAWNPPKVMHESHLPAPPRAPSIPAQSMPTVDVFEHRRAGIFETLTCALHPHQRWRDPREVPVQRMYKADNTPFSQEVAQACYWMHNHPDEREPPAAADALWCVVDQENCAHSALHVMQEVIRWYRNRVPRVRRMAWQSDELLQVEIAAGIVTARCITGVRTLDKPKLHATLWHRLEADGTDCVWGWAEQAAARAARVLRKN